MKIIQSFVVLSFLLAAPASFALIKAYDFQSRGFVSLELLAKKLSPQGQYVLGEFHYDEKIQLAQSQFIKAVVTEHQQESHFTVSWEFLNYTDHDKIQTLFNNYKLDNISGLDFLKSVNQENGASYLPIIKMTKDLNGFFNGVNAPREIKREIRINGIGSVDPQYIPPNMTMGSDKYFKRFKKAMGGHVDEDELMGYFTAQCYTDSVMAYYLNQFSTSPLKFLVVGSFHSDFKLGTVASLNRLSSMPVISLKFVNKKKLTDDEWNQLLLPSSEFGKIADYLIITE